MKTLKPRVSKVATEIGTKVVQRITGRKHGRIRQRILFRDEYTCQKCGRVDAGPGLEVDHIVPLYSGGKEEDSNREVLCHSCHRLKSKKEQIHINYKGMKK